MELAVGYGSGSPALDVWRSGRGEVCVAVDWCFSGHDSELTAGFCGPTLEVELPGHDKMGRFRLQ